jgi:hypothetical protein
MGSDPTFILAALAVFITLVIWLCALWSLSHFDERAEAARAALAGTRTALDNDRARLIAARGAIIRIKKSARMILRALELRRTILG